MLDAANNVEETVTVEGVAPTAAGEITVALAPSPNNNNGNHFTYLTVLRVSGSPSSPPLFAITSANFDKDIGQVTLIFDGSPGANYRLMASDDMVDWTELDDNILGNGKDTLITFDDENLATLPAKFYRLEEL